MTAALPRPEPWRRWIIAIVLTLLAVQVVRGAHELWQLCVAAGLMFMAGLAWVRVAQGDDPDEPGVENTTAPPPAPTEAGTRRSRRRATKRD